MALTGAPFPYDKDHLLGGAVRILYAPTTVAVPAKMEDVFGITSPYAAVSGTNSTWQDLGQTKDSFSYSRGFDVTGWEIQQLAGNVVEELTDMERTITVSVASLNPTTLKMIENAPNVATITQASKPDQKKVAFGSFSSLERYRFAFVSRRPKAAGVVTETAGAISRGRYFMGVAYEAQLSAESVDFEQAKGELSAINLSFTLFPASGQPSGEEYGAWYDEQAGAYA
jgi:hypothetical protein